MIQWIYTDSPEEQNESVTNKRNFYIGGSELNKIFEDFYKGDIIQNIFELISASHQTESQANCRTNSGTPPKFTSFDSFKRGCAIVVH